MSRNTNPFAGNITKQNEHYNYGGDPAAFVDGDTVYAYTGHDVSSNAEVDSAIYNIPEYLCYSTKDLINWNYEGVVMKMLDVSWGDPKSEWAGQVTKHNGRYYLYFCSWDRTSEGKQSIGVAVSDSPKGPFRDIGHPIVRGTLTNDQYSNWDDIDPTVWIESDKNGVENRELSKKRRDELMSTAELLDEVLLEPYISDAHLRLLVRKINVHENENGSLDVTLEFNGDFKDSSTVCFEIND